ncbi:hypothetical protein ACB092_12G053300 [Castanea dentata]
MFPAKLRMTKDNKLSPIQASSFPENELSLRFINDNIVQFCNDNGNSPKKLLLLKSNTLRFIKEPIELGICPDRLLLAKLKTANFLFFIKQSGRPPDS